MRWSEICASHPDQWLVVEALEARSDNNHRFFDRVTVVEVCPDGRTAMKRHSALQRASPQRELGFVHTSNAELEFEERLWLGIRGLRAADASA
jgi:hypothetical protein